MDIKKLENCKGLFRNQGWYETRPFAIYTEQPSWRLILRTPVEDSFDKTWNEQQALLDPKTDKVPLARELVYTIFLFFLTTGERLFENLSVRTNNVDAHHHHVHVGEFVEDGLDVYDWLDRDQDSYVGIASARNAVNLEP
jgi:hypothetical protein